MAFHISEACPPSYEVFFAGARAPHITLNTTPNPEQKIASMLCW